MKDISESAILSKAKEFAKNEIRTARYVCHDPVSPYGAEWFTKRWIETYTKIVNDILQTHRIVSKETE